MDGLAAIVKEELRTDPFSGAIYVFRMDSNNALFAGSDEGAAAWGVVASPIETCKLIGVEPHAYLADVLAKLANGWPMSRLDELLPWAYAKPKAAVA